MTGPADSLVRALALDAKARRIDREGRTLSAHVVRMRADERRRVLAEVANGVRALALDAKARRIDREGRTLAAHVVRMRADERRRVLAEVANGGAR